MRVLHVIPSLSAQEGGPSFAAKAMADALAGEGVDVTVAATTGSRERPSDYRTTGQQDNEAAESRELATASPSKRGHGARHGESVRPRTGSAEREDASKERRGYNIVCFRREFEPYKISFWLTRWLRENVGKFDLVHIHALFSFS